MLEDCFESICSFENLYNAFDLVASEHRHKRTALIFYNHLEENLIQLQNELLWGMYELGSFLSFC